MSRAPVPERAFPRGGSKPKNKLSKSADFNLFGSRKKKKVTPKNKHKSAKNKKTTDRKLNKELNLKAVKDLSVKQIRLGMVILGSVDKVTETTVQFSLPGSLRAVVSAANISAKYCEMINDRNESLTPLPEMFHIDDLHPVMITEEPNANMLKFKASLDPQDVNSMISNRYLQEGMILSGSILSIEEHGCVIDFGIPKVAAFLHNDEVPEGTVHHVGQVVSTVIRSITADRTRLQVSMNFSQIKALKSELPITSFVPGFRWKATITEVLPNGFELLLAGFGTEVKGYIYRNYLHKVFDLIKNYQIGKELDVTLMYVLPVLNYSFFRLTDLEQPAWSLSFGDLVENAKVIKSGQSGVVAKVDGAEYKEKCFIPLRRLHNAKKIISEDSSIKDLYPMGSVLPKVRIEKPSRFNRLYLAATDREAVDPKTIYCKESLQVGQCLSGTLAIIGEKYCTVELSRHVKGVVPSFHVTDRPALNYQHFKRGRRVNVRVLDVRGPNEMVRLTMKKRLLNTENILSSETVVQPGDAYLGTIFKVLNLKQKLLVEFFGGRTGVIHRENIELPKGATLQSTYFVGQVVKCYVIGTADERLLLSLKHVASEMPSFNVGKIYNATVSNVTEEGLAINIKGNDSDRILSGVIPNQLISSISLISVGFKEAFFIGQMIECVFVHHRSPGSTLVFSNHPRILNFCQNRPRVLLRGYEFPIVVYKPDASRPRLTLIPLVPQYTEGLNIQINLPKSGYFVLTAKVDSVVDSKVLYFTDFDTIWDHKFMSSLKYLSGNLSELDEFQKLLKSRNLSRFTPFKIGRILQGKILPDIPGNIYKNIKFKKGFKANGQCVRKFCRKSTHWIVSWLDYASNTVWVHPASEKAAEKKFDKPIVRVKVIHLSPEAVVTFHKKTNELIFVPTRRHPNELVTHENIYELGQTLKLAVYRIKNKWVGIDKIVAVKKRALPENKNDKKEPLAKKRKLNKNTKKPAVIAEDDELTVELVKKGAGNGMVVDHVKQEIVSDDDENDTTFANGAPMEEDEIKSECESSDEMVVANGSYLEDSSDSEDDDKEEVRNKIDSLDVGFDWSVVDNPDLLRGALSQNKPEDDLSSAEEEEENDAEKKKKKRLTGAEKKEKARENEERLRSREQELVDPTRPPQSADDFDRLVMTTPDNSAVWLQYMAFHLQNTEIEKARAVVNRALKTISFREEQERLNVWFAYLNLEQLYGSADTQKAVLEDALRSNDPYQIHLHKLSLMVDGGAVSEAEKLANAMLKKYGSNDSVWWQVAGPLMKIGKLDFARSILQRGMTSLPNSKHVALITRFAQLENKYGSSERAQTLYEHILTAFPKRVDVWSAYVDLMIKSDHIDLARQILERATSQTLPPKKMKIMLKKFIAFEEKYGTPENVEKIRQSAAEYLDSLGAADDNT